MREDDEDRTETAISSPGKHGTDSARNPSKRKIFSGVVFDAVTEVWRMKKKSTCRGSNPPCESLPRIHRPMRLLNGHHQEDHDKEGDGFDYPQGHQVIAKALARFRQSI